MHIPIKIAGGLKLPVLGFGTWNIGGGYDPDPKVATHDERAVKQAIEAGITHFDTAESYASGFAEEIIGRAVKGFDRSSLTIGSKVSDGHLRYDDVIASCSASLRRLGMNYLDLYYIHAPNPELPLEETMRAMCRLFEEGMIRHIGVSNFDKRLIKVAQSYSKYPIEANQIHYSVSAREYELDGSIAFCRENKIIVVAYRPLGLMGISTRGSIPQSGWRDLEKIGKRYGKTAVQVALNWLIAKPNVTALFKTTSRGHLEENLGAVGWHLSDEDAQWIDREFPKIDTMHPHPALRS